MDASIFDVTPLTWLGLSCAMLSGAIVGLERQVMGKPAGIRTSVLICIGTYIYVAIGNAITTDVGDPSRIIGQVVTGIGFLGAGVMLTRDGLVYGVTSAAVIWTLAAIGVMIGVGYEFGGVKLAIITVLILIGVDVLEDSFKAMRRGVHKTVRFRSHSRNDTEERRPDTD